MNDPNHNLRNSKSNARRFCRCATLCQFPAAAGSDNGRIRGETRDDGRICVAFLQRPEIRAGERVHVFVEKPRKRWCCYCDARAEFLGAGPDGEDEYVCLQHAECVDCDQPARRALMKSITDIESNVPLCEPCFAHRKSRAPKMEQTARVKPEAARSLLGTSDHSTERSAVKVPNEYGKIDEGARSGPLTVGGSAGASPPNGSVATNPTVTPALGVHLSMCRRSRSLAQANLDEAVEALKSATIAGRSEGLLSALRNKVDYWADSLERWEHEIEDVLMRVKEAENALWSNVNAE